MQLQNNNSEDSFPHSPCVFIQCQDLKTISIFYPSVQSESLQVFLVSVLSFHLMIKEAVNTGQCVHHILPEELRTSQRIWNWLSSFSSILLHFLAHCNLNLLNFTVKFCITYTNKCVGTEKGQNLLRLSTVFIPEEMCFYPGFKHIAIGAAFIKIMLLSNFMEQIYTAGKLTASILANSHSLKELRIF